MGDENLILRSLLMVFLFVPLLLISFSDSGSGSDISEKSPLLPPCPGTPNCVSSLAQDPARKVDPFRVQGTPQQSLDRLAGIIQSMPRSKIVSVSDQRMEVEFRSILGFVDDFVLAVSVDKNVIHVRSAARSGTWDLGVNRRRVERIRKLYMDSDVQPLEGATERLGD
jgi:uncharacterized protein (DUF1499 family)